MRLKITMAPTAEKFELPTNYNHLLQGLIYNQMDRALAEELHDASAKHVQQCSYPCTEDKASGLRSRRGAHASNGNRV